MSAKYVREKVRLWCESVHAYTGVPFYDTINRQVNPSEAVWWTVAFFSDAIEGVFCRQKFMEVGAVTVIVNARPGIGDDEAIEAIEKIIPALWNKTDPRLDFDTEPNRILRHRS